MIELPAGLHGAHRRADLRRELGALPLRAVVHEGRLVPFSRQVLVERGRQLELRTRAAAALLQVGGRAVLTSHTAALLFGCTAASDGRVHVLVGYDRPVRSTLGMAIHQGLYDEQDVVQVEGLRVHALECAIAELLCRAPRRTALACVDQALALVPEGERGEVRAEIGHQIATRRDPRGGRRAERLLDLAAGLAESPAESWLLLGFFDAGLPIPAQQFVVRDLAGHERYRLDFAWEEARLAVEYDGFEAHEHRAVRDAAREADLHRRGWTVLRADAGDLRDPARLHAAIRRALVRRIAA